MNISRFAKAIAYECLTALLLVISVLFQAAMHTEGQMEEAYVRSNVLLFLTAAVLLGAWGCIPSCPTPAGIGSMSGIRCFSW